MISHALTSTTRPAEAIAGQLLDDQAGRVKSHFRIAKCDFPLASQFRPG